MLEVEGEVLGPGKEGRIRLAELVVGKGLIGEGLLNVLERFSRSFDYIIIDLEARSHCVDHLLSQMRVGLEVISSLLRGSISIHVDEGRESCDHGL